MAVADALAFVEGSEYRKQAARLLAKRLASNVELLDIVEQGEGYTDEILGELLALLSSRLLREAAIDARAHAGTLGLAILDGPGLDRAVDGVLADVMGEAMDTLGARVGELVRAVARMVDAGLGDAVIRSALGSESGSGALMAPVVAVLAATGAGMINAVEKIVLEESTALTLVKSEERGEEPPLFEWETREDGRVCEDVFENSCLPRHGEELPLDEWGIFGEPSSENLICSMYAKGAFSNCRCVLRRVGAEGRSPDPINIRDAAEAGRRRAEEAWPIAA